MATSFFFALILFTFFIITNRILCSEIKKTEIKIVTDENRYWRLNPDATYTPFEETQNAKGNIFLRLGERISGDSVVVTHMDSTTFTRPTDVEISIWYPADGYEGYRISRIEFVTDVTSRKAGAYLVGDGGVFKTYAETLVCANQTLRFGYQLVVYGF